MKYYYVVLLFVILSAGCSTTSTTNTSNKGKDYSQYQNLADILRTQPGITVTGSGFNTKVVIRGTNSLQLDTRPLYIIDGVQIGRDYASANNMITPALVKSVRVIRDLSSLSSYGESGRNGVIIITTKSQNEIK